MDNINLTKAEGVYAIANTPAFLIKKLSEDEATSKISEIFSGDEILSALEETLLKKERTLRAAVLPFVLLVALWKKEKIEFLKRASVLPSDDDWYRYAANILIQTYKQTSFKKINVPHLPIGTFTKQTSSETNVQKIDLRVKDTQ